MPRAATAARLSALCTLLAPLAAAAQPDLPDDCAAAVALVPGSPAPGSIIDPPTDTDWFAFDAAAGRLYVVMPRGGSAGFTPQCIIAADGCEAEPLTGMLGPVFLSPATDQRYHIGVQSNRGVNTGGLGADAGAYLLEVLDLGPNPDLVGDTPSSAGVLPADGSPASGRIDFSSDLDLYRVTLTERTVFTISAQGCRSVFLTLFAPDGVTPVGGGWFMGSGDFGGPCTGGIGDPIVCYVPEGGSGDYFVQVLAFPDSPADFEIRAVPGAVYPPGDDFPDACADAAPITPGAPALAGVLDPATDADAFSFTALAGHFYRVEASAAVEITAPGCSGAVPLPLRAAPSFIAPADGPYTVTVRSRLPVLTRPYTLRIIDSGLVDDDTGNTPASAALILADAAPHQGVIDYAGDTDVFTFTPPGHAAYRLELRLHGCGQVRAFHTGPSTSYDADLLLDSAHGCGPSSVETMSSTFYVPMGETTAHFAEVSGQPGSTFTIAVIPEYQGGPADDHPDACGQGSPMVRGVPVHGAIDPAGDTDWFTFDAAAGHIYALMSSSSNIVQAALLEVRPPGCAAAVLDPDLGGWTFRAPVTGEYAVAVRFRESLSARDDLGSYTLTIEDQGLGEDDHPDAPAGSMLLRTDGTPAAGTAERPFDSDFFRVWLRPGTMYRIEVATAGCGDAFARLYGPGSASEVAGFWSVAAAGPCEFEAPADFYTSVVASGEHLLRVGASSPGIAYTISIHPIGCTADTDASGTITSADISAFLTTWITAVHAPPPANLAGDFSGDTVTDASDIAAFLSAWLAAAADGCP